MPFLRRRRSSFINGADHDTAELGDHLHRFLDQAAPCAKRKSSANPKFRRCIRTDRAGLASQAP
jgi:hypothetical protein